MIQVTVKALWASCWFTCNIPLLYLSDISAHPDSVNILGNVTNDVRTPDKLIDGMYDTSDGSHTWLAPVLPGVVCFHTFILSQTYFVLFGMKAAVLTSYDQQAVALRTECT